MTETVMEEYPWVGMRLDEGSPGERGRYQASASVSFVYISVKVSVGFRSALGGCSSLVTATLTRLIRSATLQEFYQLASISAFSIK
jgi:hypothetical protein